MGDMTVAEEKIVRADTRGQLGMRAAVYRAVFTEHIPIADLQCRRFADVFEILGFSTDEGEGKKLVRFPESRSALDDYMGVQHAIVT